jgi:hypothetical protein
MNGVAKDGIDGFGNVFPDDGDFQFIGWNVDELAGCFAVADFDLGCEHSIRKDTEAPDTLFDDPVIGR